MKIQKVWKTGLLLTALAWGAGQAQAQDMKAKNAKMLIQTLSEEKTEIAHLASQQAIFRKMGDAQSTAIARMFGMWIRMHKAGAPKLRELIRENGGNPSDSKILSPAVLGDKTKMLHATAMEHEAAIQSSQARYGRTDSAAIKTAMNERANLARTHLKELMPYHDPQTCPKCAKNPKLEGRDVKTEVMGKGNTGAALDKVTHEDM